IQYCKIARKQGASGVLLAPPYYALPTRRELLQHFTKVASATDLPITLYNYPGRTGVDLDLDIVVKLAAIETVVAIKESSGDATRIASIREMCEGRIAVLCGCDTLALESFAAGAEGWIGGGANFLPREHIELYELMVLQADLVNGRKLAASILPVLRQLEESGAYTQCVKAGLNIIGHPAGPPRAPLMPADEEQSRSLKRAIETLQSQPR
ncbi:MAG: dihydrodipicolinate synthase family protein, partial [Haliea sp.]